MKDQYSLKLVGKNIVEVSIIYIFYLTFSYKNDTHIWPQTHMKPKPFWSFLQYIARAPYIKNEGVPIKVKIKINSIIKFLEMVIILFN